MMNLGDYMDPIQLPKAINQDQFEKIEIQTAQPLGIGARILVEESAQKLEPYQTPVRSDLQGKDRSGKPIEVNTLGRWLFGVPGINPHIQISAQGNTLTLRYPAKVHPKVSELINLLKQSLAAN